MIKRFRAKPIPEKVLIMVIILLVIVIGGFAFIKIKSRPPKVTDFDSCVKAGNPVMESYPEQCSSNGRSYFKPGQEPYDPKQDLEQKE